MKVPQLSLFVENRPGQLRVPCQVLAEAGISILTLTLADTQQFGILRLIVREWQRARQLLEQAGCVVNVTDMVAVEVPDRPGGLAGVLEVMDRTGVNIEYMYAFTTRKSGRAILLFRFDHPDKAVAQLAGGDLKLVDFDTLCERPQ